MANKEVRLLPLNARPHGKGDTNTCHDKQLASRVSAVLPCQALQALKFFLSFSNLLL